MAEQTIELDCAPGSIRPGDLIGGVIKDLGLPLREPVSMFFGNWTWDYSDIPEDKWKETHDVRKQRITDLYNSGFIRYGSW
jgi:hypothetical protein